MTRLEAFRNVIENTMQKLGNDSFVYLKASTEATMEAETQQTFRSLSENVGAFRLKDKPSSSPR